MQEQSQIKSTLLKSIDVVREMLGHNEQVVVSRAQAARAVCHRFGLLDAPGHAPVAGCSKALVELERAGCIVLPAPLRIQYKAEQPLAVYSFTLAEYSFFDSSVLG